MIRFVFWDEWPRPLQIILFIFSFLFIASMFYALFCDVLGYDIILDWEVISKAVPLGVEVKTIDTGPFHFPLVVNNYVVTDYYHGSDIKVNLFAAYFSLFAIISALVLGITASTFLKKFWYVFVSAIFIVILVFFKTDTLLLFGWSDNTAIVLIIVSYLGLAYFFSAIQPYRDFVQRLKAFTGVTIAWGTLIYFFAGVEKPFLLLSAYAFLIPFLTGLVFIFMVSHEIMHFVIIALTRSPTKTGNNLTQFTLFSVIYLANVLILYLYDTHVIEWDFYYLNPYVLLVVSALLGLWGLQSRKIFFRKSVKDYPILVYMYLIMGIFCFGSLFYFLGNANDPILQVVKDAIIYSHLGFGAIFFVYVISNFMGMLRKNMPVAKVIYKPSNMPHFTFRFAGSIVVLALFLVEDIEVPVNQTLSGMFNHVGDYYNVIDDNLNAETYYHNGMLYGYMNHRSNYALAGFYESKGEAENAIKHYENAVRIRPSEMAYVNLSTLKINHGDLFKSLFVLDDGQRVFPSGKAILNNKGYLFSLINIPDSALIYFDASHRAGDRLHAAATNYLALLAHSKFNFDADSVARHYNAGNSSSAMANVMLLRNMEGNTAIYLLESEPEDRFTENTSALWVNYLINQYRYADSTVLNELESKLSDPTNSRFQEQVGFSLAIAYYQAGYIRKAVEKLRQLALTRTQQSGRYFHDLGLLMMDLGDFRQAVGYFELALTDNYSDAGFKINVCKLEYDQKNVFNDWIKLAEKDSLPDSETAKSVVKILAVSPEEAVLLNDAMLYLYLHYKKSELNESQTDGLFRLLDEEPLVVKTGLDLAEYYYKKEYYGLVEKYMDKVMQLEADSTIRQQLWLLHLDNLARQNDISTLEKELSEEKWIPFDRRWYYHATIANGRGDSEEARRLFEIVKNMNPFHDDAILASAAFFQEDQEDLKSYNILVEALLQNPYSAKLVKAYILECLDENLNSYALNSLSTLKELIDDEDYTGFVKRNEQLLQFTED